MAFFGIMFDAALRPGEAVDLRREALAIPSTGWGELYLSMSAPSAGRSWSEAGASREPRQLKRRGVDEVRIVPAPPEPTAFLLQRLDEHSTTPEGRLERGGPLSESLYGLLWALARTSVLTSEEPRLPLLDVRTTSGTPRCPPG